MKARQIGRAQGGGLGYRRAVNRKAQDLIRQCVGEQASQLTPEEIEGRALLLGALFNGLTALSVRQPDMAQRVGVMAPVMRRMLKVLLAP